MPATPIGSMNLMRRRNSHRVKSMIKMDSTNRMIHNLELYQGSGMEQVRLSPNIKKERLSLTMRLQN